MKYKFIHEHVNGFMLLIQYADEWMYNAEP